jgi:hypothetical protein
MITLVLNYQTEDDKKKFQEENKDVIAYYNVIYVNNRNINGAQVDLLKEVDV